MALAKAGLSEPGRESLEKSLEMAKGDFPGIEEARKTLEQLKSG